jgi:hypothetical protein
VLYIQSLPGIRPGGRLKKFIPKRTKARYTEAKAYRPISPSSFLFETEKLVGRYIRDDVMMISSLH